MRTINPTLSCTPTKLMPSELEGVSGGNGPGPVDIGTAAGTAIEGTWKALHAPDAPSWSDVRDAINTFNERYNPVYWLLNRVKKSFNGPKGGTYVPATANPDGTINPGHTIPN